MSDLEKKLENIVTLDKQIEELSTIKSVLEAEVESLKKQSVMIKTDAEKETAQIKHICEISCQEKQVIADNLLVEANKSLATALKREQESLVIEKQHKDLIEEIKEFETVKKDTENIKAIYLEKEKKASLLIEQYTKKLEELGVKLEEPKEEVIKEKKSKKK